MNVHQVAYERESLMENEVHLTRKLKGCEDRHCPAVWETSDPEMVAVQGARMAPGSVTAAGDVPAHEDFVVIPRAILASISQ
jgi:hypothetical protein